MERERLVFFPILHGISINLGNTFRRQTVIVPVLQANSFFHSAQHIMPVSLIFGKAGELRAIYCQQHSFIPCQSASLLQVALQLSQEPLVDNDMVAYQRNGTGRRVTEEPLIDIKIRLIILIRKVEHILPSTLKNLRPH